MFVRFLKKGSKDKAENYRPVSLTSIAGKILESIIKDSMVDILEEHKLFKKFAAWLY